MLIAVDGELLLRQRQCEDSGEAVSKQDLKVPSKTCGSCFGTGKGVRWTRCTKQVYVFLYDGHSMVCGVRVLGLVHLPNEHTMDARGINDKDKNIVYVMFCKDTSRISPMMLNESTETPCVALYVGLRRDIQIL